jgi:hypothetical protein
MGFSESNDKSMIGNKTGRSSNKKIALTRRTLLELAGFAVAGAALPSGIAMAKPFPDAETKEQGLSPITEKLSTYMSEASGRPLPDEVIEKAKHHILDTFAAMISGSGLRPGRAAIDFVHAYGGREVATVVASNIVCGPIEAALANGVLAHSDETDDSHGPSGPGGIVCGRAFHN